MSVDPKLFRKGYFNSEPGLRHCLHAPQASKATETIEPMEVNGKVG
jgi:hypothetical protein